MFWRLEAVTLNTEEHEPQMVPYCSVILFLCTETRLEGWLSLPVRNNTKRFGWERKVH